ncbi:MAG: hypothetical protein HKP02_07140 [Xanthomonadales bacterium]|nr:hypothetical protein [Xanthomonadales bacterium]
MKSLRCFTLTLLIAMLAATGVPADDGGNGEPGKPVLKAMTGSESGRIQPDVVLEGHPPEAEHAFTGMMPFYLPMQSASGLTEGFEEGKDPTLYFDVDGVQKDTRLLAKPLVNVFIYGPGVGVDGTAFAHSFMDTYSAISLDDGLTWKPTNLSESSTQSSFNLDTDHDEAQQEPLPADHRILLGSKNNGALHAPGYEMPYTAHCTECHGRALTGTAQAPSCYSCHGSRWKEEPMNGVGPIVYEAIYKNSKLVGSGENADSALDVDIVDGFSGDVLFSENVTLTGTFSFVFRPTGLPPCTVAAAQDGDTGPAIQVVDKDGVPLEDQLDNEGKAICQGPDVDLTVYPGGTYNVFHAVAGDSVLVAWPSRFCQEGQPAYSFAYDADPEEVADDPLVLRREAIATYLGIDVMQDLYLTDLFGVAGAQGSIDFADEGYAQAGVVPFGCVWTARGKLVAGDDPRTTDVIEMSYMRWFKPERLTSGRRDPNRIEVKGVAGAGFVITWQEDPEGIRPGQGLGPGEGWSGAVAHPKTDVWYSFIPWEHFSTVQDPADDTGQTPMTFADYELAAVNDITQKPKPFVPMAVPMRLTNNDKCNIGRLDDTEDAYFSYCNFTHAAAYGLQDFCADRVSIPLGSDGELQEICVSADGLPNIANTATTRPRLSLQGYDSDGIDSDEDGSLETDSAWVIVAAEESKGLGRYAFLPDGTPCDAEAVDAVPECTSDIGKNQWYFSFDMGEPATSATFAEPYGLVQNLVNQGNMLNQPEVDWRTGEFYPAINTELMWNFGDYNFDLYNTEIARRASLLVQGIGKAEASTSGLLAMPSWKQGVMRQGGPADTMLRRIVATDFTQGIANNPYAFTNMSCGDWLLEAGDNPYYPDGLCGSSATNLSGVVPDTCIEDENGGTVECPSVDTGVGTYGALVFPSYPYGPELNGVVQGEGDKTRVLTWHQCPSSGSVTNKSDEITPVACGADGSDADNLDDQSWYNPLDISKGHRGFIDGDFVMFLYAWSPNWRLNAKGSDRYDLYIRRSFTGGADWTTTPSGLDGNGTVTCESYRTTETGTGEPDEPKVCYLFPAGGAEHARNVTQHKAMRITTLDPRYAATAATIPATLAAELADAGFLGSPGYVAGDETLEDVRDPSRFFIVFETGDNSTVKIGEAEPLDLFYSRAVNYGDDYEVWAETEGGDVSLCFPNEPYDVLLIDDPREDSGFCNEFDKMEQGTPGLASSEASLKANPGGEFLYGVWTQIDESSHESDAMARRIWWIDGYISDLYSWTLPGTNNE